MMEYSSDSVDSRKSKKKKVDPSFKSKRYRDKLRAEVKALENLIPVDRQSLNKKLDSQTVYRLAIAYLRVQTYLKARRSRLEYANVHNKIKTGQIFDNGKESGTLYDTTNCDNTLGGTGEHHTDIYDEREQGIPGKLGDDLPACQRDDIEQLLDAATLYQVIDGFVLLISTDGTIMFVTENISKYTGFSQVDLIHRCLYSLVHPEDFQTVKNTLEVHHTRDTNDRMPSQSSDSYSRDEIENFFCKIRCYHGNTSGYIKLHCSGAMYHLSEMPNTSHTSKHVTMIYCQPFLKTGNDVFDDEKKEVFWSKHDLDLKFKEIEELSPLGYSTAELCGKSLYQFVHPEDLCILDNVHKEVTRVTEVQTFFFRLETKSGDWLWVYCKGKVVCKNSKKFSIVFSHCPMRDDDNVFVKQETLYRRHRLASVLQASEINQAQPQQYGKHTQRNHLAKKQNFIMHPYINQGFESVLQHEDNAHAQIIQETYNISCPSSWHASSERHSPILPNNHAAQKLFQRERHLYFAEYRRKQFLEQNRALVTSLPSRDNFVSTSIPFYEECQRMVPMDVLPCFNVQQQCSNYSLHQAGILPYMEYHDDCRHGQGSSQLTDHNNHDRYEFYPSNIYIKQHYPSQTNFFFDQGSKLENFEPMYDVSRSPNYQSHMHDSGYNCVQEKRSLVSRNIQNFYSSANLRFSVVCNSEFEKHDSLSQNKYPCASKMQEKSVSICENKTSNDVFKSEDIYRTCAKSETKVPIDTQPVKYDVEASIYMRIVEAHNTDNNTQLRKHPTCKNMENQNVTVVS